MYAPPMFAFLAAGTPPLFSWVEQMRLTVCGGTDAIAKNSRRLDCFFTIASSCVQYGKHEQFSENTYPMPMSKEQLLDRLKSDSLERLLNSPYFQFSGLTQGELTALFEDLHRGGDDLAGKLRPLLLMSTSFEIQGMSESFSGDGTKMSDKEAADRAKTFVGELLRKARSTKNKRSKPSKAKPKKIGNKSGYPHVDWLDEAKLIGTIAGTPLVLLGHEQGTDDPIVSRDIDNDPYFVTSLSELLMHSQDPIEITVNIDRD